MIALTYRPNTGREVQGWAAEEAPHHQGHKSVVCTSCWRIHLVNPVTGEVLDEGADE
jgi:hypothetical protein